MTESPAAPRTDDGHMPLSPEDRIRGWYPEAIAKALATYHDYPAHQYGERLRTLLFLAEQICKHLATVLLSLHINEHTAPAVAKYLVDCGPATRWSFGTWKGLLHKLQECGAVTDSLGLRTPLRLEDRNGPAQGGSFAAFVANCESLQRNYNKVDASALRDFVKKEVASKQPARKSPMDVFDAVIAYRNSYAHPDESLEGSNKSAEIIVDRLYPALIDLLMLDSLRPFFETYICATRVGPTVIQPEGLSKSAALDVRPRFHMRPRLQQITMPITGRLDVEHEDFLVTFSLTGGGVTAHGKVYLPHSIGPHLVTGGAILEQDEPSPTATASPLAGAPGENDATSMTVEGANRSFEPEPTFTEPNETPIDAILRYLNTTGELRKKSEILEGTGLADGDWIGAITVLKQRDVVQVGYRYAASRPYILNMLTTTGPSSKAEITAGMSDAMVALSTLKALIAEGAVEQVGTSRWTTYRAIDA